jgi:hypothetical protein
MVLILASVSWSAYPIISYKLQLRRIYYHVVPAWNTLGWFCYWTLTCSIENDHHNYIRQWLLSPIAGTLYESISSSSVTLAVRWGSWLWEIIWRRLPSMFDSCCIRLIHPRHNSKLSLTRKPGIWSIKVFGSIAESAWRFPCTCMSQISQTCKETKHLVRTWVTGHGTLIMYSTCSHTTWNSNAQPVTVFLLMELVTSATQAD